MSWMPIGSRQPAGTISLNARAATSILTFGFAGHSSPSSCAASGSPPSGSKISKSIDEARIVLEC